MDKNKQEKLFNNIKDNLLLFGSRAYGCETEKSDYDFICTDTEAKKLIKFLNANNYHFYQNDSYTSSDKFKHIPNNNIYNNNNILFNLNGKQINIISYSEQRYESAVKVVKHLTDMCKNMSEDNMVQLFKKDKEVRINITLGYFRAIMELPINSTNDIDPDEMPFG